MKLIRRRTFSPWDVDRLFRHFSSIDQYSTFKVNEKLFIVIIHRAPCFKNDWVVSMRFFDKDPLFAERDWQHSITLKIRVDKTRKTDPNHNKNLAENFMEKAENRLKNFKVYKEQDVLKEIQDWVFSEQSDFNNKVVKKANELSNMIWENTNTNERQFFEHSEKVRTSQQVFEILRSSMKELNK